VSAHVLQASSGKIQWFVMITQSMNFVLSKKFIISEGYKVIGL